jgi:hypothetical protein
MSASSKKPETGAFYTPRPEPRSRMLTCRITEAQDRAINERAAALKMDRADLVRAALDFWFAHGPQPGKGG